MWLVNLMKSNSLTIKEYVRCCGSNIVSIASMLNWWESKIVTSFHTTNQFQPVTTAVAGTTTTTVASTVNYHSTNTFCMCPWSRTHQIATCFSSNYELRHHVFAMETGIIIILFIFNFKLLHLSDQCFSVQLLHNASPSPSFLIIVFRLFYPRLVYAAKNRRKKNNNKNQMIRFEHTCIHTYHANKRDKIYWWLFILFLNSSPVIISRFHSIFRMIKLLFYKRE